MDYFFHAVFQVTTLKDNTICALILKWAVLRKIVKISYSGKNS